MKEIVEILRKNGIICKSLKKINLNTRKKIKLFLGVNLKNEYCLVVVFEKRSTFLTKDLEILNKILENFSINFRHKKKILILNGKISYKAKKNLNEWRIFWF